jgi:hypothetical protein
MSPKFGRRYLSDGSFIERTVDTIKPDEWRPHGYRYRLVWIQNEECRVLFDNHHGKTDHMHIDGHEKPYQFMNLDQLLGDFYSEIKKLGGPT